MPAAPPPPPPPPLLTATPKAICLPLADVITNTRSLGMGEGERGREVAGIMHYSECSVDSTGLIDKQRRCTGEDQSINPFTPKPPAPFLFPTTRPSMFCPLPPASTHNNLLHPHTLHHFNLLVGDKCLTENTQEWRGGGWGRAAGSFMNRKHLVSPCARTHTHAHTRTHTHTHTHLPTKNVYR